MKVFFDALSGSFKLAVAVVSSVITAWLFIEARWDSKVAASEHKIMEKVLLIHDTDMLVIQGIKEDTQYIKQRLDRIVDRDLRRR